MNLLTRDDPKYGLAYYRAMKLDTDVSKIVAYLWCNQHMHPYHHDLLHQVSNSQSNRLHRIQSCLHNLLRLSRLDRSTQFELKIRFHCATLELKLYVSAAEKKGHGMLACSKIIELTSKGLITRDGSGRLVNKMGQQ